MNHQAKNNQQFDVIGVGACGVDLNIEVPMLPKANDKVTANKISISSGGVTANNIVQCAKLGLHSAWTGSLGNDDYREKILEEFEENEITSFPISSPLPTQQFYIFTSRVETAMVGLPGATRELNASQVEKILSPIISQTRHLHTEVAVIPLVAALTSALVARKNNVKVLLDIDGDPNYLIEKEQIGNDKEFEELLKNTDVVKLSRSSASGLLKESINEENIQKLLEFGPQLVVVTLAEKGCLLASQKEVVHAKGFSIIPVDTTGASDAFMGGLSYGVLQNWGLKEIGQFANACGAFKTTKIGTRSSGTIKEIQEFIAAH